MEVVFEDLECLARGGEDEIEVDVVDAGVSEDLDCPLYAVGIVPSFEDF